MVVVGGRPRILHAFAVRRLTTCPLEDGASFLLVVEYWSSENCSNGLCISYFIYSTLTLTRYVDPLPGMWIIARPSFTMCHLWPLLTSPPHSFFSCLCGTHNSTRRVFPLLNEDHRPPGGPLESPQRNRVVAKQRPHCPRQGLLQTRGRARGGWEGQGGGDPRGVPIVHHPGAATEVWRRASNRRRMLVNLGINRQNGILGIFVFVFFISNFLFAFLSLRLSLKL